MVQVHLKELLRFGVIVIGAQCVEWASMKMMLKSFVDHSAICKCVLAVCILMYFPIQIHRIWKELFIIRGRENCCTFH